MDGFANIHLIDRPYNVGLARNIIEGVTTVLEKHDRVIVVEDDIVTSPAFLTVMNTALDQYELNKKVWYISGFMDPITMSRVPDDFFFWRVPCVWGWATWRDRWAFFKKDAQGLLEIFDPKMIRRFNLDAGYNFFIQVQLNAQGLMNTWAIFWYATIFLNDGLCLSPTTSYVRNIGHDNSGVHSTYNQAYLEMMHLNQQNKPTFPLRIKESRAGVARLRKHYLSLQPNLYQRAVKKLKKIFSYELLS